MAQDYHQMWTELGLDLDAHNKLLNVLEKTYNEIYLSRQKRPEGMKYFDFVMSEVHGLRIKELIDAKKLGKKIIGSFCVFVPEELILAMNGISVGLCAGAEFGFSEAEKFLPRNTCPLIKSAFGFKLSKVCPYVEACDMVAGENTCDGKKKSYEIFKNLVDNLYVIDLPQTKSEEGKNLLKKEYQKFIEKLKEISGNSLEVNNLKKAIMIVNKKRKALHRLSEMRKYDPLPISGLDALLINQIFFYDDPERFTESVNKICDELESKIKNGYGICPEGTPRILISGCPMAIPNWKIHWIVENSNAVITGEESCVGERGFQWLTDETGDSVEKLLNNIVERYFKIDCAIFTPNPSRLEHIIDMVNKYNAQGVIHYNLQFCQPYQIEGGLIETALEKNGIPVLQLNTDYSNEDVEQIKTRVEAFIERIRE